MFTGIVESIGIVKRTKRSEGLLTLKIEARGLARKLSRGHSVAINGVCLTATRARRKSFEIEVMGERDQ